MARRRFTVDPDVTGVHKRREQRAKLDVGLVRRVFEEDLPGATECAVEFVHESESRSLGCARAVSHDEAPAKAPDSAFGATPRAPGKVG